MDTVDSPFLKKKQKKSDPMMSELQMKLRQRRIDGLTAEITDDDDIAEEVDDDGDDSEDEILAQYRIDPSKQRRTNRPSSAKRRSPSYQEMNEMALGDTLRPGAGSRFMKGYGKDKGSVGGAGEGIPALSPKARSPSPGMPSLTSPKSSPKSPLGETDFGRKDGKGRKSPLIQQQPLSKEDIIFGRKTPTYDTRNQSPQDNKPWQPPSFRKSPSIEQLDQRAASPGPQRAPSPGQQRTQSPGQGLQGRRTPLQEPFLQTINESKTSRGAKQSPKGDRKSPSGRQLSIEDSPRSEAVKPKPRHKTDIFGQKPQEDFDLETDSPSGQRFMRAGRKTPTQGVLQGRKTPTLTDSFGRKTPTGRKSSGPVPAQRKTAEKEESAKKEQKKEVKKQASVLDFLAGDVEEPKKTKFKKEEKKPKLLKGDSSGDLFTRETSIRDDILVEHKAPSIKARERHRHPEREITEKDKIKDKQDADTDKQIPDDSSMCEEFEKDPFGRSFKTKEDSKIGKKKTEGKQASDDIDKVAMEQDKPSTIKPIDPDKSFKKGEKVHKPKPRHTLPGTPSSTMSTSDMSFNDTMSIRQAVYEEWRQQRIKSAREKKLEEKKKKDEEDKKKEEEKKEKALENESSYKEWLKQKKETHDPEVKAKKLKEEEKKKKEEEEKDQKKKEAEKNFKLWNEGKEALLKEKKREEQMKKRQEERSVEEKKREKEKENSTAMRGWQRKKEEELKAKAREEKQKMKQTIKEEENQKKVKEKEAAKLYEDWLKRKDKTVKQDKRKKLHSMEFIEERPAWSPASKTIPFGR